MEFHFADLLPSNLVHALGVTLFHSLWVGVILAVITSLVILFTRKQKAVVRYNLLTASLSVFIIVMGGLFYQEVSYSAAGELHMTGIGDTITSPVTNSPGTLRAVTDVSGQLDNLINLWVNYSAEIVLIWFLIICARSIQLLAGIHSVNYLRRTRVFDAGTYWEEKVILLSAKMELSRTVKIMQSGLAKVPLVAGHFKPVILLPLGLLNGLSIAEVEAIISHELAHVKRRDYIVNILQSAVEIIFFFNPAVLWISKLIREERENCCDDLVLGCTDNKQDYIRALISCQEFQANAHQYAMAATGQKNQLLLRVSRMVFNSNSSLNRIEKTVLGLVLVFTMLFTAAFTNKPIQPAQQKSDNLTAMDSRSAAFEEENWLQDTTKKVKKVVKKTTTLKQSGKGKKAYTTEEINNQNEIIAAREEVKAAKEEVRAARAEAAAAKAEVIAERARAVHYGNVPPAPKAAVPPVPKIAVPAAPAMPAAPAAPATPPPPPARGEKEANSVTDAIKTELLRDKLISQTKNMSYKLSKDEFVVNGKTQSDALRKKYMRKFLKHENQTIQTRVATD